MEKLFKLQKNKTTVSKEIVGGLTTFFAMAYILAVNPGLLGAAGMDGASVFTATCIASALGCILTAFLSNTPFAQAPGMGLNAFFAFTVAGSMGYTWQQALAVVFISGVLFLLISVSPLRGKIIASIPASLKAAISAGIGLFIAFVGVISSGSGIIHLDEANNITELNLYAGGLNMAALVTIIGIILIAVLMAWNVKGAIFIGVVACTIISVPLGVTSLPNFAEVGFGSITLSGTFLKMDFGGLLSLGVLPLITAVVSFTMVDMFDTMGTLIGTAGNNDMLDKDGNMPGGDKAIIADAVATVVGAALGTSTVTTYVESSAGISAGARTGLSSLTTGIMFLLALVLAPFALMVPGAATAPALIIVGVLMMKSSAKVAWDNIEDAIPAFLTISMMPFSYSISDGIAFGFISYSLIKVLRGKAKEVPALLYIISILFVVMYVLKGI